MEEIVNTTVDTQPDVSTETAVPDAPTSLPDAPDTLTPTDAAPASVEADQALLEVKYNKQLHTLSREDATKYAQKGMKYDAVEPLLRTLKGVAEREGKTLAQWVDALGSSSTLPPSPDEALARRLAAEYVELCREVPSVGAFNTLPPEAVRQAAEEGLPLLDAYLRHEHRERCRVEAERAAQAAAAAAGTGTQASGAVDNLSSVEMAMMRGVWAL